MTKPYLTSHQLIITKTGSNIKTKADLKGKIVGSQSESSGEEAVKKSGEDKTFKEFKTYAQYDQAFMDLGIEVQEVIQQLTCIIKDRSRGEAYQTHQIPLLDIILTHELVELVQIAHDVLAVVKLDGTLADDRRKRIGSIRQGKELEGRLSRLCRSGRCCSLRCLRLGRE